MFGSSQETTTGYAALPSASVVGYRWPLIENDSYCEPFSCTPRPAPAPVPIPLVLYAPPTCARTRGGTNLSPRSSDASCGLLEAFVGILVRPPR